MQCSYCSLTSRATVLGDQSGPGAALSTAGPEAANGRQREVPGGPALLRHLATFPLATSRYSQGNASKTMSSNPVKKLFCESSLGVGFGRPLSKEAGIRQFITLGTGMEDSP